MKKIILTLLILTIPHSALAYSELIGLFLDDGVRAMSRGGMERQFQGFETADFNSPLSINSLGKSRLDTAFENGRTARVFSGSWSGSHAYSDSLDSSLSAPYSFLDGNLVGSLAAGYSYKAVDIKAQSFKEDITISSDSSYDGVKGGLYLSVMKKASLGVAFIDTGFRSRPEIPIELEISPLESPLRFGYKRSYRNFPYDFNLEVSGKSGAIPFNFNDNSDELYAEGTYADILTLRYANELKQSENRKLSARLKLPRNTYLAGSFAKRQFRIHQDIYAEGSPGGYLKGEIKREDFRAGIGIDLAKWNLEANFRRQRLNADGGGIADSSAVVSFWPSLIVGNYNYLYHAGYKTNSFQLGGEFKGESFSFSMGGQYIDFKPVAELDYWRSILFGLGRTGEDSWKLTKDQLKLLFVSVGFGYKWENVSLQYSIGQFIPVASHDTEPKPPSDGGGAGTTSSGKPNMLTHNPGGNIQRILISFIF